MVSTVMDRKYVVKKNKKGEKIKFVSLVLNENKKITKKTENKNINATKNKLFITNLGKIVTTFLIEHFNNILDYNFTAQIENMLDEIANGKKSWTGMLRTLNLEIFC